MAGLAAAAGDTCVLRSRGDLAIAVCIPAPTACVFTRSTSSRRFLSSRLPFSGRVVRCALASFPCARAISPRLLYGIVSADEDSGAPAPSESRTAPEGAAGAGSGLAVLEPAVSIAWIPNDSQHCPGPLRCFCRTLCGRSRIRYGFADLAHQAVYQDF